MAALADGNIEGDRDGMSASDELFANLALTALPHREISGGGSREIWRQRRGNLEFEFISGRYGNGDPIGVAFGPTARLILIHQLTEATRTGSPEVSLGPSANQWIGMMKGGSVGGRTYRQFSNQSLRLGTCTVSVTWIGDTRPIFQGETWLRPSDAKLLDAFVQDPDLIGPDPWYSGGTRKRCATGMVNRRFLEGFDMPPVRLSRKTLHEIGNNSSAIDLYIWLLATTDSLAAPKLIPWGLLAELFMGSYTQARHFRTALLRTLQLVQPLIPLLHIDRTDEGWTIHPPGSRSRVPEPAIIMAHHQ